MLYAFSEVSSSFLSSFFSFSVDFFSLGSSTASFCSASLVSFSFSLATFSSSFFCIASFTFLLSSSCYFFFSSCWFSFFLSSFPSCSCNHLSNFSVTVSSPKIPSFTPLFKCLRYITPLYDKIRLTVSVG